MTKFRDLTGQKFGRLTVIERAENSNFGLVRWKCLCECGNTTIVQSGNLIQGNTKSCGCIHLKQGGKSHSRLYHIWNNMKSRCYNPSNKYYKYYGGRGISICDEWKNNFQVFYDWAIANGYSDNLSIDRMDASGNYCPDNCRWATIKEQQSNKRNNRYITYNGKTQTIAQWAKEIGIKTSTLHARLNYQNWDIEKALTTKRDN